MGHASERNGAARSAVGYLRVSGRGQVDGDGFPRQRAAIEEWANKESVEVVEWYVEEGVSGTLADRPALARMLVELEANHVDVSLVEVEKVDRLARELYVQESIIRDVSALGRDLVSATEGDLSGDPSRVMVRQVFGALAQYDRAMLVQKLSAARSRKRVREGRCEGRKPFGDRPGESETLERIRELRRKRGGKRLGFHAIAKALNDEGRQSRTGKPWVPGTVRDIIKRALPGLA